MASKKKVEEKKVRKRAPLQLVTDDALDKKIAALLKKKNMTKRTELMRIAIAEMAEREGV